MFKKAGVFLLKYLVLPIYNAYLNVKRVFNRFYSPLYIKNHLIHPFSRRYLTHLTIVIISILVVTSNLNAYEVKRDDATYKNIMVSIVSGEEYGNLEEGPVDAGTKKISRYLYAAGVENRPHLEDASVGSDFDLTTVAGGSALVKPILSPSEVKIRQRDEVVQYIVAEGDTISAIAENFGITVATILWENNLTSYSIIRPGQKLTVLPTSGLVHKVVRGETLGKIADKYKADAEKIIEYNKLASADDIRIGESLMIPGGFKPQPVQTYTLRTWTAPTVSVPAPSGGKMSWPGACGRITQYYSWRHYGLDIACPFGSSITAADNGTVIKAQGGWNGGYGILVVIDHGNGVQTLYGHLSKLYVSVGDEVSKSQSIGAEGSTGRSTGPHVHFEVRVGGSRKNPLTYIK